MTEHKCFIHDLGHRHGQCTCHLKPMEIKIIGTMTSESTPHTRGEVGESPKKTRRQNKTNIDKGQVLPSPIASWPPGYIEEWQND